MPEPANQAVIRRYAVLTGLTPLVPLPFIDDLIRAYLRRRLVRALASARGEPVPEPDVRALTDEPARGCWTGCLILPLVYVLKRLFRKIFFFLEWKRAVDTASETYHRGVLLDHALQKGWCRPDGPYGAARVRAAVDAVLARAGTGPVEKAVRETFDRSRSAMGSAAQGLKNAVRGMTRRTPPAQTEQAIAAAERVAAPQIDGVAAELGRALEAVEPTYFQRLAAAMEDEMVNAGEDRYRS